MEPESQLKSDLCPAELKPRILILSLGGTIAMTRNGAAGALPTLTAEALVEAVPELQRIARVECRSVLQVPSVYLSFEDLESLSRLIQSLEEFYEGFVVTQGTDTIEESAFIVDRLVDMRKPVVFTGAMRTPMEPGADGPANLLAAVCVAASPDSATLGCVVVFNDEVHSARYVQKRHATLPSAFVSPVSGPVGFVTEGRLRILSSPPPVAQLRGVITPCALRVPIITYALDDDGSMVLAMLRCECAALVVAAAGGGHVSEPLADALASVATSMPVVLTSRTGAGQVLASTYGFVGSEMDLTKRGVIHGGWLDPLKARALLVLMLRHGFKRQQIAQGFRPWGAPS